MNLLNKPYQSIADAAKSLKYTIENLIYFGSQGRLGIAAFIDFKANNIEAVTIDNNDDSLVYATNGYYYLLEYELEDIVLTNNYTDIKISYFMSMDEWAIYKIIDNGKENKQYNLSLDQLVIFNDDVDDFIDNMKLHAGKSNSKKEKFNLKERDSLLKIVITMASAKYNYVLDKRNSASQKIADDANSIGINIDPDTILKYLKKAAQLLPRD